MGTINKSPVTDEKQSLESPSKLLTPRELEIMELVAKGLPNKEIAVCLQLKIRTVEFHVSNILSKLGASSRVEAVLSWIKNK